MVCYLDSNKLIPDLVNNKKFISISSTDVSNDVDIFVAIYPHNSIAPMYKIEDCEVLY